MNPYENEELNAIREGVRALCAEFPAEYWRKIDEEKGFPEAFVKALTDAGWLSAMIPEEYGGSGLGLAEASVILEEVNRLRRQLRHRARPDVQHVHPAASWQRGTEALLPAQARQRRTAPAIDGRHRAHHRHRHHQDQDHGGEAGRQVRDQRPEGLDLAHSALRPDDPAGAHHAVG